MTAVDFLITLAAGRLMTWLIMSNGITKAIRKRVGNNLVDEFLTCDLCVGFWVFLVIVMLSSPIILFGNVFIDVVVSAAILSMLAHLVRIGYTVQYSMVQYD